MSQSSDLEQPRGAVEELASDPGSRKKFFKLMGGAGAATAFSLFVAACGEDEKPAGGGGAAKKKTSAGAKQDLEIVQYALTLEHLETDFYNAVIKAGVIKDKALAKVATTIRDHEQEHVDALTRTVRDLGGKPKKPKTTFDSVIEGGPKMVLETAATVENLGAAAYLGQAARIQSKEVLAAALAIHSIEARHAAALNNVVGKTIVPDGAFAKPASMKEVLPKVQPFLVS
jgi:rubrerythrin